MFFEVNAVFPVQCISPEDELALREANYESKEYFQEKTKV